MLFSWFELLLLIGVTQGLITSALLLRAKDNRESKRLLALVLIGFCIISIKMVINTLDLINSSQRIMYFPLATELAIAPLFYLYSISLISLKFQFNRKQLFHFAPFAIFMGHALFIYLNVYPMQSSIEKDAFAQAYYYTMIKKVEDYLTVLSILVYLSIGSIKLKTYREQVRNNISDSSYPVFNWLRNIFILSAVLFLILIVNMILDRIIKLDDYSILHWKIYFIYIGCVIYYLGFKGYKLQVLNYEPFNNSDAPKQSKALSKISSSKVEKIATAFEQLILGEKLYLNPTISTLELAKVLEVSQSNLSYAINQYFGKSFREFVNELRIQEVKLRLVDIRYQEVSILAMALECGFNSEASFYRIFKKSAGISPTAFQQSSKAVN